MQYLRILLACFSSLILLIISPINWAEEDNNHPITQSLSTQVIDFNIPAKPLDAALQQFSEISGIDLGYNASITDGLSSSALSGKMPALEALQKLLQGTNITWKETDKNALVLQPKSNHVITLSPVEIGSSALGKKDVQLELMEVIGKHERDIGATGLPLAVADTPQSISIVDSEFMEFYNTDSIGEALMHSTGVYSEQSPFNSERFAFSRGFELNRFLFDGMGAAGLPTDTSLLDSSMFEGIEVIRGSTGMLQELGQPSGTVNLIQKRAQQESFATLGAEVGSWNRRRLEADVNTSFNQSGSVRGRAVAAYEKRDAFQDYANSQRRVIYTTLAADITDDVSFSLFINHQQDEESGYGDGVPMFYSDGTRVVTKRTLNVIPDWMSRDTRQNNIMAELDYQINENWSLRTRLQQSQLKADHTHAFQDSFVDKASGNIRLFAAKIDMDRESKRMEVNAIGQFELMDRQHSIVIGGANSKRKDLFNSRFGTNILPGSLTDPSARQQAKPTFGAIRAHDSEIDVQSLRVALNFSLLESLNLLLGANHKKFEIESSFRGKPNRDINFSDTSLYLGGVYNITEDMMLYASYTDIFDQQSRYDKNEKLLDPITGKNQEIGFRYSMFENSLSLDIAAFKTKQENYPARQPGGYHEAIDGVESKGLEFELSGYITDNLTAGLGFTKLNLKSEIEDRITKIVPRKMAKLNMAYDFDGNLQGLRLGGYINYVGKHRGFIRGGGAGSFFPRGVFYPDVSSHVLVGLAANYYVNSSLRLKLNINNLLDKKYDSKVAFYSVRPGDPRNYTASINYDF